MFVLSKRNIILPAPDGSMAVRLRAGMMETVPEWAADSIAWCLNEGVVNGVDESGTRYVEPASIVDRATMAQIMVNAIDAEALSR